MKIKIRQIYKALYWSAILLLSGVASIAVAQSVEGTQNGGGLLIKNYGSSHFPASSTPLMREFYFGFDVADSSPSDHHIAAIRVLPGGSSTDLSPNAQAPHHEAPSGKIELMYQDKNPDDEFFYKIAHGSTVPGAGPLGRFQIRDVGCVDTCERDLPNRPANAEFALVGFYIFYTGDRDRHVDRVAVFEDNGKLVVTLADKNPRNDCFFCFGGPDVFGYMVDYTWVNTQALRVSAKSSSGTFTENGGAEVDLPNTDSLRAISGFSFDHVSGDRHLRDIGAQLSGDKLTVFYGDKKPNEDVRWRVKWIEIGGPVVFDPAPGP